VSARDAGLAVSLGAWA